MDDNRKKALDAALSQIERQFGKGAVMRMGDQPREAIPAVSTGSLGLDIALGIRRAALWSGGGDLRAGILR